MYDIESEQQRDPALKHWPFKAGIIPVLFPRRKQLLFEIKQLRAENERLELRVSGLQAVVDAQSADLIAAGNKSADLHAQCLKAYAYHKQLLASKDADNARLQRKNAGLEQTLARAWNTHLVGGENHA